MIQETTTFACRTCGSTNTIKNETNKCGNPQYHYKDCGVYRVIKPTERHTSITKLHVLRAALILGVYRDTMQRRKAVFGMTIFEDMDQAIEAARFDKTKNQGLSVS